MIQGSLICKDIQTSMRETIKRYETNKEQIDYLTGLRNDKLHQLEGSRWGVVMNHKWAMEVRELSETRRRLKAENRSIEPLYNYIKQHNVIINEIANIQGLCRKEEERVTNSIYRPRSAPELGEAINESIQENGVKFDENLPEKKVKFANHKDKIKLMKELKHSFAKLSIDSEAQEIHCWRSKI